MSPERSPSPSLDPAAVERRIHELVNENRTDRGVGELSLDGELSDIARGHSEDMAEREYVAHESPEGDDFLDRFAEVGYECRVPTSGARYLQGGENVGKTYFRAHVEGGDYYESVDDLAAGIVGTWMDSRPHRENIVGEHWRCEGVGIAVTEERGQTAVYATQNFC